MKHRRIAKLDNKVNYSSGNAITPIDLATDSNTVMTRVELQWEIHLDIAASPVYNTLALPKCTWNQFAISGGGDQFVSLSKPMLLLAKNRFDRGIRAVMDPTNVTVSADSTFRFNQVLHFGSFSRDPWDLSAGIICNDFAQGSLQLSLTCPANTVAGTNITINNTTLARVDQYLVTFDTAAELNAARLNIAKPNFYDDSVNLSIYATNASGYDSTYDLPIGQFLRRTTFLLVDNATPGSAQAPDDTRIQDFGLLGGGSSNRRIIASSWYDNRNRSHEESDSDLVLGNTPSVGGVNVGMVNFDFTTLVDGSVIQSKAGQHIGSMYGLDLTDPSVTPKGNFQYGFSVNTANGQLQALHEKLMPGGWS